MRKKKQNQVIPGQIRSFANCVNNKQTDLFVLIQIAQKIEKEILQNDNRTNVRVRKKTESYQMFR